MHAAHELGSWEAALAVGLLVAAWQPRRAAGLLPFALALAGAMVATATFDIVTGHAPAAGEAQHILDLLGVGALWLLTRSAVPSAGPRRASAACAPRRPASFTTNANSRAWLVRSALLALLALLVLANPAHADPAKPGDFESTVTRIDPPTDAISLKVVGGDGFLSLKVQPGHDVDRQGLRAAARGCTCDPTASSRRTSSRPRPT